jgi:hypothetical protein
MKTGKKRRQLIYDTACEPVMQARIKIARMMCGHPQGSEIDMILAQAMDRCGSGALAALDADMRDNPSARRLIG